MSYQLGSLLLVASILVGPMLVDPVASDAVEAGLRHGATASLERAEGLAAPAPEGVDAQEQPEDEAALALATPRPTEWMPEARRCRRRGARRFCDGPRRIPLSNGEAAERAEALGLGERSTASVLINGEPNAEWTEAAGDADGTILFPVEEGTMGRGFGFVRRRSLRHVRHDGVDIPAAYGTAVRAVDAGIVAYADNGVSGYGNFMILVHGDGSTSHYAHLRAAYFFAGQQVARGQTIGEVGSTGLSQAPHLHFEYRRAGHVTDPVPHFTDLPEQVQMVLDERAASARRAANRAERRQRRARRERRAARRAAMRRGMNRRG